MKAPSYGTDEARPGQLTCLNEQCSRLHRHERGYLCGVCAHRTKPRPAPVLFESLGYAAPAAQPPPATPSAPGPPRRPGRVDRLQPELAGWTTAFAIAAVIACWLGLGPVYGVPILLVSPLWVVNVVLGGSLNDPLIHVFARARRFRAAPEDFLPRRTGG